MTKLPSLGYQKVVNASNSPFHTIEDLLKIYLDLYTRNNKPLRWPVALAMDWKIRFSPDRRRPLSRKTTLKKRNSSNCTDCCHHIRPPVANPGRDTHLPNPCGFRSALCSMHYA